jgi:hypothetical protein
LGKVSVVMIAVGGLAPSAHPARSAMRRGQAGLDAVDGQAFHDDAGGERQHLFGRQAELRRQRHATRAGAGQAVRARAGVGVAGVDQQCPHGHAGSEPLAAELHRRRTEAIAREHTRHAAALDQAHHRQIAAVGLAHAGFGDTDAQSGNRVQIRGNRSGEMNGHGVSFQKLGR